MIIQLNPSIPVIVTSKDNRTGEAMFLDNRSPEHHVYWGVVFDDTGEIWWVPNPEIRVTHCWTVERPPRKKEKTSHEIVNEILRKMGSIDDGK